MDRIRALIVDDELQSRSLIRKLLADHFPQLLIAEADNIASAIDEVNKSDPALIFLDIQMRGETGFDLLDKTSNISSGIIFVTAHNEFAVRAFRYSAMDYLMKPLDTDEFRAAVSKALDKIRMNQPATTQIEYLKQIRSDNRLPDKLTIPTSEGFLFISLPDILYCRAVSNYTEFYLTGNRKLLSSYTLGYYNELLADRNFFRVHRSYLIHLAHIKMYKKSDGGTVVMNNGEEIEVSRSNKDSFLRVLKLVQ